MLGIRSLVKGKAELPTTTQQDFLYYVIILVVNTMEWEHCYLSRILYKLCQLDIERYIVKSARPS